MKIRQLIFLSIFSTATITLRADEALQEIVVAPGETLWSISNKYLKDPTKWSEIIASNPQLSADPSMTLPGTRIRVPVRLIKEEFQKAQLIESIPDVQYKKKGEENWVAAGNNMNLFYEDSLRTLANGGAKVRFPTREIIQINENSYIVLRPQKILQEVRLIQGDVRASKAKVIMPNGTVVKPRGDKSDYQAKVREDNSEVVFVYKGKVDVTAQGKTITVPEGFGTHVPKFSAPSAPEPLQSFKDYKPIEIKKTTKPAKVPIQGNGNLIKIVPPAPKQEESSGKSKALVSNKLLVNYRVQIAKDENFQQIVHDKNEAMESAMDLKKLSIPDGTYYMRVAFLDAMGVAGEFSEPSMIIKDTEPPKIKNLIPNEGQKYSGTEAFCDVSGIAEGATLVAINNEVVFTGPKGQFSKVIPLGVGQNKIEITARDASGNETLIKRNVFYSK